MPIVDRHSRTRSLSEAGHGYCWNKGMTPSIPQSQPTSHFPATSCLLSPRRPCFIFHILDPPKSPRVCLIGCQFLHVESPARPATCRTCLQCICGRSCRGQPPLEFSVRQVSLGRLCYYVSLSSILPVTQRRGHRNLGLCMFSASSRNDPRRYGIWQLQGSVAGSQVLLFQRPGWRGFPISSLNSDYAFCFCPQPHNKIECLEGIW